jgi:predicted house-cleaning NTP pyrophosphatase (Maf/HAM1 superfamily)
MKGIVDRFEGEFVVIEVDGITKDFLKSDVDANVIVGDTVVFVDGKWLTDKDETKSRSKEIKKLMDDVWED